MDNWDEIRTAYQVARMGTVSGAAEVLGVHHATVIRHIDAIEGRLGVKLFQRHARGYTPTEAGQDLLRVAQATEDQFNQLSGRLKGQGDEVTGELVVTSLASLSPLLVPVLSEFQAAHPGLIVRFLTGERLFRLEYGEAHVAIRAGSAPDQPDNVVQRFADLPAAMYASEGYIAEYGKPASAEDFASHHFVGADDPDNRAPFSKWLYAQVSQEAVIFRCNSGEASDEAILSGAGIGFMSVWEAERHPGLVQVLPPQPEWASALWLVTHVDLHRTNKVQSFLRHLKERSQEWCK
ncbi:LysR family transcriptional regulator [Antarcticimicrobium luteum]|uniref:LysR family transcriptional regulator n=1 Tax=Antarcticimicrobium luteum TaxID=2547397 RepID=A0A4R5V5E6_9RHOB|nr:LysR family transcriptional regulator [Antarcticimicrobium luteum]TDK46775.1 LysR family transcriptional regulator [Antarcticimicrobium luteum]